MSLKNPTIYDVAQYAGVSPATVSRVLNDPSKVAAEKRNKILAAIKELGFVPKAEAVAVARKFYRKICVIAPFFTQPAFMQRLRGVESVLNGEHFEIVIYSITGKNDLSEYIKTLTTLSQTDGLILFSLNPDEKSMELLKDAKFPVCFIESGTDDFDCVEIQNVLGGEKAAQYLYGKGCRNPGFVGEEAVSEHTVSATADRFEGFRNFFAGKKIKIRDENVWIGEFKERKADEGIRGILNQKKIPDCVFCSSDLIATRFIALAGEKGIRVPEDIRVIGFDDIDLSRYTGLSSVSQSLDESGVQAAKLVLSRLTDLKKAPCRVKVPVEVIERKSSL